MECDYIETRSVTLEWKVTGLKALFEGSKGESKSKCVKSALFDSHRWQIFLYPNSGHEQYCSLYLSCEPTLAEKERGLAELNTTTTATTLREKGQVQGPGRGGQQWDGRGPWKRDGKFKFTFQAKSLDKSILFKEMDAHDHSFSDTARNWGYQSFWKRSEAYFNNATVRTSDGFFIICTIVESPTPPSPPPAPRLLIPKDLVSAYASLFDDEEYSDVVFVIKRRGGGKGKGKEKRVYAAKKILRGRAEYFDSMFGSGFQESSTAVISTQPSSPTVTRLASTASDGSANGDDDISSKAEEEEEDDLEEGFFSSEDDDEDYESTTSSASVSDDEELSSGDEKASTKTAEEILPSILPLPSTPVQSDEDEPELGSGRRKGYVDAESSPVKGGGGGVDEDEEKVGLKRTREKVKKEKKVKVEKVKVEARRTGKAMTEVVITDASYTTYRALLYYLYTDSISFTPLSSSYLLLGSPYPNKQSFLLSQPATGGATPCSAKAIYRLADMIGLNELKERANEFIVKNLTVENIPYEVFGSFSARFDEIRKVEIAFLLEKWNEVRASPSMHQVLKEIRTPGKFQGFEEVFARLLGNLEVKSPREATLEEERV